MFKHSLIAKSVNLYLTLLSYDVWSAVVLRAKSRNNHVAICCHLLNDIVDIYFFHFVNSVVAVFSYCGLFCHRFHAEIVNRSFINDSSQ